MNQQATTVSPIELSAEDALLVSALLKIAVDAQNGYATAAHDAKSEEHRNVLHQYAHQRQTQAAELDQLLRASGHATNKMGTVAGAFHQGWINLRAILTQGDRAILQECVRADELAMAAYHDFMRKTSNYALVQILQRQVTGIREAHDQLVALTNASHLAG
jgi:uncharacterized protein (TIGR02284 family)